jgi:hypothetical protein
MASATLSATRSTGPAAEIRTRLSRALYSEYLDAVENSYARAIPEDARQVDAACTEKHERANDLLPLRPEEAMSEEKQRKTARCAAVSLFKLMYPNASVPAALDSEESLFDADDVARHLEDPHAWEQEMLEQQWDARRFVSGWRQRHVHGLDEFFKTCITLGVTDHAMRARMDCELNVLREGFRVVWRHPSKGAAIHNKFFNNVKMHKRAVGQQQNRGQSPHIRRRAGLCNTAADSGTSCRYLHGFNPCFWHRKIKHKLTRIRGT